MKKQLFLSAIAFFLSISSFAQQYGWQDISSNLPNFPKDTMIFNNGQDTSLAGFRHPFFLNDDEGWISTGVLPNDSGVILHTTDGGNTWEVQQIGDYIMAVEMLNKSEGYAAGRTGTIYHTTNGGNTWDYHASTFAYLLDMDFPLGSDTGYACGDDAAMFRITAQGAEQMAINTVSHINSVHFISPAHGWACGESVLMEYKNGSWGYGHAYPTGSLNGIFFTDSMNGWIAGYFYSFPLDTIGIIHTSNDSAWFTQPCSIGNTGSMNQVFFLDNQQGWAISFGGYIYATTNGGNTWNRETGIANDDMLTGIQFTSPTNGYICGNSLILLKYTEISGIGDEVDKVKIEVYPNPAVTVISLQSAVFSQQSSIVELFDLNGKKLLEKSIPKGSEEVTVDVSRLQNGVYLCRIQMENGSVTKKLIIKY